MGRRIRPLRLAIGILAALSGSSYAQPQPERCEAVAGEISRCSGLTLPVDEVKRALRCVPDLAECQRAAELSLGLCRTRLGRCQAELAAEQERSAALDAALAERLAPPPPHDATGWHVGVAILSTAVVGLAIALGVVLAPQTR